MFEQAFCRKTHDVKLLQGGYLTANNVRVIDPDRTAEFSRQSEQIFSVKVSFSVIMRQ